LPDGTRANKKSTGCKDRAATERKVMEWIVSGNIPERTNGKKKSNTNVDKINFYLYENGVRTLVNGYKGPFTKGIDLVEYQIWPCDEAVLPGTYFKTLWEGFWYKYENADDYRIGFYITFDVTENGETKTISKRILEPKDTESYFDYIQTWMYDDTHKAEGQWYSHVTNEEMNDEVKLTAIKFTGGDKVDSVNGLITLTAFYYKDELDFDEEGRFIGEVSKTIEYIKEN